ncbi:MAG: hypothetical protein KIT10_09760 [Flavobacteriales bacterium]|nr:hypothetical protein [Flavobacteriales bacterium]
MAAMVQPLDAIGDPDPVNGKAVWLSIGMSNTSQESGAFIQTANAYPGKHPALVLVNGGVGGQTAVIQSTPTNPNYASYWNTVDDRLTNAGVTAAQVQVIWLKVANQAVTTPLPEYYDSLLTQTKRITHELKGRFPHVRICYVASRIYGGYASGTNPEPYAHWQGWVMKHLIEAQIEGDPELAYTGPEAVSPWLAWGVYLWADGTTPRSDGLTWECPEDFQPDGLHPSPAGRQKVADLLLDFFSTDPTACPWFMAVCSTGQPDNGTSGALTVHPNPARDQVTVGAGGSELLDEVALFDAVGRCVILERVAGSMSLSLALDGLAPGTYSVRAIMTSGSLSSSTLMVMGR